MSCVFALLKTVGKEVNGVHLISTFVKRRVHPIQAREHPIQDLSAGEVEAFVCALTMLKVGETHVFDPPVTPSARSTLCLR